MSTIRLILQLVTVLGPRFKEILPIIMEIIADVKGVTSPAREGTTNPVPGFTAQKPVEPATFVKHLTDVGVEQVEAEKLHDLVA